MLAGRYQILEPIAVGGMAEVFKAKLKGPQGFEKIVAVKRILSAFSSDKEFRDMFIDEAKIATILTHTNIIQVHELGEEEGSLYIVMEFVDGVDLKTFMGRAGSAGLPFPLIAYIGREMAQALHYAHRKGVIHRDVSPQNILISREGNVKLADFGIAKASLRASETSAGMLKGKFAYMSPEQASGIPLDMSTDIFSLGIVLYEMAAGQRLFLAETDMGTLKRVQEARVEPLSAIRPQIFQGLENAILRALKKDPGDRQQSARELADELDAAIAESGVRNPQGFLTEHLLKSKTLEKTRRDLGITRKKPRGMERTRSVLWAGGISLTCLVVAAGIWMVAPGRSPNPVSSPSPVPSSNTVSSPKPINSSDTISSQKPAPVAAIPKISEPRKTNDIPTPVIKPSVKKEGILNIGAKPWAEVYIDDVKLEGNTPLKGIRVTAGKHIIKLVNPRFKTREVILEVEEGESRNLIVDLRPTPSGQ